MIELKNLIIGYSRDAPLFPEMNYVFENKIYGITGKSGVGKTTLLRTIAGLNKQLSGDVINPDKEKTYMMHQNYSCFDWLKAIDNILISAKVNHVKITKDIKKKAMECIKKVDLEGFENYYPTELSGGMRQRLSLARTLFMNPKVILMDEPFSALDDNTRTHIQDLVLEIHNETQNTIIMVTHSQAETDKMCDYIIKL